MMSHLTVRFSAVARLDAVADGVEQVRQGRIIGGFLDGGAGGADVD